MRRCAWLGVILTLGGCAMVEDYDYFYDAAPAAAWHHGSACDCQTAAAPAAPVMTATPPAAVPAMTAIPNGNVIGAAASVSQSPEPDLLRP
jgi:hypothetical protein